MHLIRLGFKGHERLSDEFQRSATVPRKRLKEIIGSWRDELAKAIDVELSGETLQKRTGALTKSVDTRSNLIVVEQNNNTFLVTFRRKILVYGPFLETGGTIKPTKTEYLAIPLRPSDRLSHTRPSKYKNKFFRKAKSGGDPTALVMYWKRKKERAVPIFLLKKEVSVYRHPWFTNAVAKAIPELRKLIRRGK